MLVEKELFAIANGDHFILYAPTARTAIAVTSGVLCDLQACEVSGEYPDGPVRDSLLKAGILIASSSPPPNKSDTPPAAPFKPTHVTLASTSDCGLRCIYCYASAGVVPKVMEFSIAKAAIDLIMENAIASDRESVDVTFHGGGEPLYGGSGALVRAVVAYAKDSGVQRGLTVSVSCATNGVLSMRQLTWAAGNLDRLNLSLDGPPDIQDAQRPLRTGGRSSPFVERTLAFLERHKLNYGVRCTVTRASVARLTEIVEYVHRVAPSANIHLEPLFSCGRCATTGAEAPDTDRFVEAFVAARQYARGLNVKLYNSGSAIDRCGQHFCGATKGNFCVTPWGDVTSCYEVTLPSDTRAPIFFFGTYDPTLGVFRFDEERLARLSQRNVSSIQTCSDCFMKYSCCGDCPAKQVLITGTLTGGFRCNENRMLGASSILDQVVHAEEVNITETVDVHES